MQIDVAWALERAARKLETDGWMQSGGVVSHLPNPNCASTAITATARDEHLMAVAQWTLAEYLTGSKNIIGIWKWNDAPGQTKENVIATMRACAAIWRAKQENTDASKGMGSEVAIRERGSEPEAGVSRGTVCHDLQTQAAD
jgi:hypothetical protein